MSLHKDRLQVFLHSRRRCSAHKALDEVRGAEEGLSSTTASQPVLDDPLALQCLGLQHATQALWVSPSLLRRRLQLFMLSRTASRLILEGQVGHGVLLQAFKQLLLSQEGHGELGDLCEDSPAELDGQGMGHHL